MQSDRPFSIVRLWNGLRLAQQFLLGAALVLVAGMTGIVWWVSQRISHAVTENTAQAAALYMEGTVSPLVQGLKTSDRLSEEAVGRLHELLGRAAISDKVVSMKVWRIDGTVVYSRWPDIVGKTFPLTPSFKKAAAGMVGSMLDSEPHVEDSHEKAFASPLLEVYAPVRDLHTREVIAVSEFYVDGQKVAADIRSATLMIWFAFAGVTMAMFGALSGIVRRGSRTIEEQRMALTSQVRELQTLVVRNDELQTRLREANRQVAEVNESILQRTGADLHDGPAQLLTYALLRLNRLSPTSDTDNADGRSSQLGQIRSALSDALTEVRNLSMGLSLPQLDGANLQAAVMSVVAQHEEHTGTKVAVTMADASTDVPQSLKVCLYRFVQEGLANAYRHAGGIGQCVTVRCDDRLTVRVSDQGGGFDPRKACDGLGLTGLRARIEALGGTFVVTTLPGHGTELTASFDAPAFAPRSMAHG